MLKLSSTSWSCSQPSSPRVLPARGEGDGVRAGAGPPRRPGLGLPLLTIEVQFLQLGLVCHGLGHSQRGISLDFTERQVQLLKTGGRTWQAGTWARTPGPSLQPPCPRGRVRQAVLQVDRMAPTVKCHPPSDERVRSVFSHTPCGGRPLSPLPPGKWRHCGPESRRDQTAARGRVQKSPGPRAFEGQTLCSPLLPTSPTSAGDTSTPRAPSAWAGPHGQRLRWQRRPWSAPGSPRS